uniref:ubiquitinyl hydrolase 1 n=1 Tax=Amphilophus citrinellus TaxID=61819 RepID=A0A3Q0S8W1_AMPCI
MDGGGSMQSNDERGVEKLMDDYLKSIGLHRKKIAKDGSCLFRAVAEQVLHCQSLHTKVRAKCVEFLEQNRDNYEAFIEGDFEDYLCKLQDPQVKTSNCPFSAMLDHFNMKTVSSLCLSVLLCFLNGNHYDSVYPINHIKNTALCQSILYELLYEGVFKVDRSCLGSCQRVSRPSDLLSDDCMPVCASSDESDLETDEPREIWIGCTGRISSLHRRRSRHMQESSRVRRSLNPTLLRNVEYDVWHKTKRAQQKMDYCIAAGMQFTVGDRCQVRLEGSNRPCNAIIKEVPPDNQSVIVYIEHQGRKQVVPLWSLRPPSDDSGWSKVVSRDKRLTAPGSGGRVLKQHSWPPQGTAEEQGGAKTSRSVCGWDRVGHPWTSTTSVGSHDFLKGQFT